MCDVSFSVEAVVRGYHEYKDNWVAVVGEELSCRREPTNREDRFAVASLASRIASAGMMEDRGPFGSGNCLSCRFTTPAPGLK